jgi:hypothetical protein
MAKPDRKPNFKRPAPRPFKAPEAVFVYVSACCNEFAKKPSVLEVSKQSEDKQGTLGKFRCSKCGKRTKVSRHLRKEEPKPEVVNG